MALGGRLWGKLHAHVPAAEWGLSIHLLEVAQPIPRGPAGGGPGLSLGPPAGGGPAYPLDPQLQVVRPGPALCPALLTVLPY